MDIIPAIDLIDGRCVRLRQGNYGSSTTYYPDPLDAAKAFADCGLRRLHLVDLDGAKNSTLANLRTLERIASALPTVIDYSGGIRAATAIDDAFSAGAAMVAVGSMAVREPATFAEWLTTYGPERIILSADIDGTGHVATRGWTESSGVTADSLIDSFAEAGLKLVTCTEIARDGMLCGLDMSLYKGLAERHPDISFTASGGVSSPADIEACAEAGMGGVIVGKAFYEGKITLAELTRLAETLA